MEYDERKVRRDVRKVFRILAENQNIKIRKEDFPYVRVNDEDDTSYFNNSRNEITIHPSHIAQGYIYFEEAGHALRNLVEKRRINPLSSYSDPRVGEFLGRCAETIGRDITKGTRIEYLFKNIKPRSLRDPETRKKWIEGVQAIRKSKARIREIERLHNEYEKFLQSKANLLMSSIKDYASGNIDSKDFEKRLDNLAHFYSSLSESAEILKKFHPLTNLSMERMIDNYNFLREQLKNSENFPEEERRKKLAGTFEMVENDLKPHSFEETLEPKLRVLSAEYSHFVHRKPYELAEKYSTEDLGKVFKMNDRAIKRKFFKNEKLQPLEKIVGLFFIVVGILVISTLSITGAVIGDSFNKYNIVGLILFFIGLYLTLK